MDFLFFFFHAICQNSVIKSPYGKHIGKHCNFLFLDRISYLFYRDFPNLLNNCSKSQRCFLLDGCSSLLLMEVSLVFPASSLSQMFLLFLGRNKKWRKKIENIFSAGYLVVVVVGTCVSMNHSLNQIIQRWFILNLCCALFGDCFAIWNYFSWWSRNRCSNWEYCV